MSENNSELVLNCSSHILCGISAFDKATFSGQDAVLFPIQHLKLIIIDVDHYT